MRLEVSELERIYGEIWQNDYVSRTVEQKTGGGEFSIVQFRTNLRGFDWLCSALKTADFSSTNSPAILMVYIGLSVCSSCFHNVAPPRVQLNILQDIAQLEESYSYSSIKLFFIIQWKLEKSQHRTLIKELSKLFFNCLALFHDCEGIFKRFE